ncbi:hypothetical protein F5X99DRAFT_204115 [Biscogniauxia marginata]|nr:hypothetical protein F5X99DRAFT_204115 [Biscogniauxia marginata]
MLPGWQDSSTSDNGYAAGTVSSYTDDPVFASPHSTSQPPDKFTAQESYHCSCLQQHAQLVYQLGDLEHSHAGGPTVDRILQGVRLAQEPWKNLMQCSQCQIQDNQKEVFLLFSMSIRTLLSSVQKLIADVISVVIRSTLQSIATALLHLWERSGRPRQWLSADIRDSNGHSILVSPNDILNNMSAESQKPPRRGSIFSENMGTQDTSDLLNTLQSIAQAMKQEFSRGAKKAQQ